MSTAEKLAINSWCAGTEPLVLSEIFASQCNVAVWQRQSDDVIQQYFEREFKWLGLGMRTVFAMSSLKEGLNEALPDAEGKDKAVEDIFLLADMLTCLFGCDHVGVRLVPLNKAMCPNFHVDNIPVRLVCTYLGAGTEWLPTECVNTQGKAGDYRKLAYQQSHVQQLGGFDVGLLKGSAWDDSKSFAAVHRSCAVDASDRRVLLTLDPM